MGPASLLDISLYVIFRVFDQFRIMGKRIVAYVVHLVSDRFDPVLARLNARNHLPQLGADDCLRMKGLAEDIAL